MKVLKYVAIEIVDEEELTALERYEKSYTESTLGMPTVGMRILSKNPLAIRLTGTSDKIPLLVQLAQHLVEGIVPFDAVIIPGLHIIKDKLETQ